MLYWDRPTLKMRSKDVLRKSYWVSFAVSLVIAMICGNSNFSFRFNIDASRLLENREEIQNFFYHFGRLNAWPAIGVVSGVGFVFLLFSFAYMAFVGNIFQIGNARYYTMCRYNNVRFGEIVTGFKNGFYLNNVKTMFLRQLYIFLWSLLLIVPGIIMSYKWWMVPYILAENPTISQKRAFEISERTTDGEKMEMFVLDLSFTGWFLLGALCFGVGVLFVRPYYEATLAELYGALRYKAIQIGSATRDEIGAEL